MKALITGGAGFIGSHLSRHLLSQGWEVAVVDDLSYGRRENVPEGAEFIEGRAGSLTSLDADVVFHLAAEATVKCSPLCWERNVEDTSKLARLAAEASVPVVYTSSAAVYGPCRPCREEGPLKPLNLYGATKACGELALSAEGAEHVSLRLFNVYGEGMNPAYGAVVYAFITKMLRGERPAIFGDGRAVRDYIYVGDVVRALERAALLKEKGGAVVNVGTGRATSVVELYRLIAQLVGFRQEPVFAPPRPGDIPESVASTDRMKALLGIEPTPLERALPRVVEFYRRRLSR